MYVRSLTSSTMSTGLNSMSGVIYEDMIKPCFRNPISNVGASRIMKATVVIIGAICVGLVFMVEKLSGLIQVRFVQVKCRFCVSNCEPRINSQLICDLSPPLSFLGW